MNHPSHLHLYTTTHTLFSHSPFLSPPTPHTHTSPSPKHHILTPTTWNAWLHQGHPSSDPAASTVDPVTCLPLQSAVWSHQSRPACMTTLSQTIPRTTTFACQSVTLTLTFLGPCVPSKETGEINEHNTPFYFSFSMTRIWFVRGGVQRLLQAIE